MWRIPIGIAEVVIVVAIVVGACWLLLLLRQSARQGKESRDEQHEMRRGMHNLESRIERLEDDKD